MTHAHINSSLFRHRVARVSAITALLLGASALSGCEQPPTQTAEKPKEEPAAAPAESRQVEGIFVPMAPSAPADARQSLSDGQAALNGVQHGYRAPANTEGIEPSTRQNGRASGYAFSSGWSGDAQYMSPPQSLQYQHGVMSPEGRDKFPDAATNPVKLVGEEPVSTFSADVDTASYAVLRKFLNAGALPPEAAVRVEEMVNYFDYAYPLPETRAEPFRPTVAVYKTPWNPDTQIVHIGIKGFDIQRDERPTANLVFLLDVSGSMNQADKLPLVQKSLRLLVNELKANDRVSIVVYAGAAGMVLEPTSGANKAKILGAIDRLSAGGSTAGAEGIRQAYQLARSSFIKTGVNRVILATDGDFNVGITDPGQLESFVARERESGVTLSVLGFGMGNYNDALMQKLAQKGNGNAAYIDSLNEARKVLVEQVGGTLFTIAKDVKYQIEFNPARVSEYRLIGYETRLLNREDFNNDKIDAGDIGAGHAVTALYEIVPAGSNAHLIEPLRYPKATTLGAATVAKGGQEIAFLRMRYKLPNETKSRLIERPVTNSDVIDDVRGASEDLRFAAAVAGFGQVLRNEPYLKDFGYAQVVDLASGAKGRDPLGHRAEFVQMVRLAQALPALPALQRDGQGGPQ